MSHPQPPTHGGDQYGFQPPELWLPPGADLPKRTWQRRSRRPVIVISTIGAVLLAAIAVVAVVFGAGGLTDDTFTARGAVILTTDQFTNSGDSCRGTGDVADLRSGTKVRIADADTEKVLADGRLTDSTVTQDTCRLDFEIGDVPTSDHNYLVVVGVSTAQTVTENELRGGIRIAP
ncbi:hypothetical protein [Williamsia sterculiae]|uniref:Uncharacterized protein n=1 Tax=Williamsia sterculiae TaxID=1344003 RepID=A0A1N7H5N1_9NOCA|nr:hypothetical protein [Williamsia sterculiae]SIS20159.1 hypothetical protein SAMN05445060_3552 [Williamsia sterculiae]